MRVYLHLFATFLICDLLATHRGPSCLYSPGNRSCRTSRRPPLVSSWPFIGELKRSAPCVPGTGDQGHLQAPFPYLRTRLPHALQGTPVPLKWAADRCCGTFMESYIVGVFCIQVVIDPRVEQWCQPLLL